MIKIINWKERILNLFLSRKFIALVIGVSAYYLTPFRFDQNSLLICIGIYTRAIFICFSLPFPVSRYSLGSGRERGTTGKMLNLFCVTYDYLIKITFYDNTYPGANGYILEGNVDVFF